ncbi:MAG: squalene-hopene/tetraprenyl-beta-curcumene cyclase [Planctomycetota bacterium]|jgi:squalene-hopene/tetraprenyl-beta-curcumene cyclase
MSAIKMSASLHETLARAREGLLQQRCEAGHWRGLLSSSSLSTATAVAALAAAAQAWPERAQELLGLARRGRAWLASNAGQDGGFGDTVDSPSNLSTSALAWMALGLDLGPDADADLAHGRVKDWLLTRVPTLDGPSFRVALEEVYGKDQTFAVPILVALAAGEAFEGGGDAWASIPALPCELAALPQGLFRFLGLPVVSYALPALIAIGQAIAHKHPSSNPLARAARAGTRRSTLRKLARLQPDGGGFLEATPLTSFVVLALCSAEEARHVVVQHGLDFLCASMRADGSWPIDTDLATWGTTLAVNALGSEALAGAPREALLPWILDQQLSERHVYTGAAPGGWAWTDLPGGVPDADDTPGALLALAVLDPDSARTAEAAARGLQWLMDLQNRDGGMPTFCRGWGALPFDKSCADLTAHALRAAQAWAGRVPLDMERFRARSLRYLVGSQQADGAWVPLWFGNQAHPESLNPVYGTSRVLRACAVRASSGRDQADWNQALRRGLQWLLDAQGEDGGFGGGAGLPASIEETSLALEALSECHGARLGGDVLYDAIEAATAWLVAATRGGTHFPTTPIGLYFAQLWYHEELYPRVFCVSALELASKLQRS